MCYNINKLTYLLTSLLLLNFSAPQRTVVRRGICYDNVCASVRPSVCLAVTPKRFKIGSKYALQLHHTTERFP